MHKTSESVDTVKATNQSHLNSLSVFKVSYKIKNMPHFCNNFCIHYEDRKSYLRNPVS